jgi:hypothetical protein
MITPSLSNLGWAVGLCFWVDFGLGEAIRFEVVSRPTPTCAGGARLEIRVLG